MDIIKPKFEFKAKGTKGGKNEKKREKQFLEVTHAFCDLMSHDNFFQFVHRCSISSFSTLYYSTVTHNNLALKQPKDFIGEETETNDAVPELVEVAIKLVPVALMSSRFAAAPAALLQKVKVCVPFQVNFGRKNGGKNLSQSPHSIQQYILCSMQFYYKRRYIEIGCRSSVSSAAAAACCICCLLDFRHHWLQHIQCYLLVSTKKCKFFKKAYYLIGQ